MSQPCKYCHIFQSGSVDTGANISFELLSEAMMKMMSFIAKKRAEDMKQMEKLSERLLWYEKNYIEQASKRLNVDENVIANYDVEIREAEIRHFQEEHYRTLDILYSMDPSARQDIENFSESFKNCSKESGRIQLASFDKNDDKQNSKGSRKEKKSSKTKSDKESKRRKHKRKTSKDYSKAVVDKVEEMSSGDTLSCSVCDKIFLTKKKLKCHLNYHKKAKISCDVCGKGYMGRGNLSMHQRIHQDVRPFQCTTCNNSFRQKNRTGTP